MSNDTIGTSELAFGKNQSEKNKEEGKLEFPLSHLFPDMTLLSLGYPACQSS